MRIQSTTFNSNTITNHTSTSKHLPTFFPLKQKLKQKFKLFSSILDEQYSDYGMVEVIVQTFNNNVDVDQYSLRKIMV